MMKKISKPVSTPTIVPEKNVARNRLLSAISFELMAKYMRLSVEGVENIPRNKGPVIFISNHSGFSGLDALILRYLISKKSKTPPKIMLHRLWYFSKKSEDLAERWGFVKAKYYSGVRALKSGQSLLLFPEGAHGNFKPYSKKYRLQSFKTGFLRMARDCQCQICPVLILGPEESHINLKKIDMTDFLKDTALPVPLNVWPLPAKWRVHFLKPFDIAELSGSVSDEDLHAQAKLVQTRLQKSMDECLAHRGHPFL